MTNVFLQPARKGETQARQWTLKADGIVINLETIIALQMRYRIMSSNTIWKTISTLDNNPMLVITDAANGVVIFTPTPDFWSGAGLWELYFSVDAELDYNLQRTDNYIIKVVEGV